MAVYRTTCKQHTTADKKDAYRIREIVAQTAYQTMLGIVEQTGNECNEQQRAKISRVSTQVVSAILKEPKIEIILKRRKSC